MNMSPITRYSDVVASTALDSNRTLIADILTIPAIPVYNGSKVVCLAAFIDGSPTETTPPAILTIIIMGWFDNSILMHNNASS